VKPRLAELLNPRLAPSGFTAPLLAAARRTVTPLVPPAEVPRGTLPSHPRTKQPRDATRIPAVERADQHPRHAVHGRIHL